MTYDIFISYKRLGASSATAAYLYELLLKKGYNVFFDRKEMRSGKFNEQLLEHISNAQDIIILLEEHSLDSWFSAERRQLSGDGGQSSAYKTDWFCQEVMHALKQKDTNIIPILLDGYQMPAQDQLPPEMLDLSLHNALSLDISEIEEFYQKNLVEKEYLKSKPKNLAMSRMFQNKGAIVGQFLFYTSAESCDLLSRGERVITLTDDNDEDHPFCYPVSFAGEHRFVLVNNDTCEMQRITRTIDANCQVYVEVKWKSKQNAWELTEYQIKAQRDANTLFAWGKGLFEGNVKHDPDYERSLLCLERAFEFGCQSVCEFVCKAMQSYGRFLFMDDDERQLHWIVLAAKSGDAYAQHDLGFTYIRLMSKSYGSISRQVYAELLWNNREPDNLPVSSCLKAKEWYLKAAEQGNTDAMDGLCKVYGWLGKPEMARPWAELLVEKKTDYSAVKLLAEIYQRMNLHEEALQQYERCLSMMYKEKATKEQMGPVKAEIKKLNKMLGRPIN